MKNDLKSNSAKPRKLHGCLPLFFLLSVGLIGGGLWVLPVQMPLRQHPSGQGRVYYHSSGLINYEAARKSPLTLRTDADPGGFFYKDSEKLYKSVGRDAELRKAPPLDILPLVANSVVINRDLLLELPPEHRAEVSETTGPGEGAEIQPEESKEVER